MTNHVTDPQKFTHPHYAEGRLVDLLSSRAVSYSSIPEVYQGAWRSYFGIANVVGKEQYQSWYNTLMPDLPNYDDANESD